MIEAGIVMGDIFNTLLMELDEQASEKLGGIPGVVFQRHFTTLFAEMSEEISLMVLDLIFTFGSGFMRGTSHQPQEPINDQKPLCRTQ